MLKESCDFYNWFLKVLLKILVEGWVEIKTVLTNNCTEKSQGKSTTLSTCPSLGSQSIANSKSMSSYMLTNS